jgi:hypothetical protein
MKQISVMKGSDKMKHYEQPDFELSVFDVVDIITESDTTTETQGPQLPDL